MKKIMCKIGWSSKGAESSFVCNLSKVISWGRNVIFIGELLRPVLKRIINNCWESLNSVYLMIVSVSEIISIFFFHVSLW